MKLVHPDLEHHILLKENEVNLFVIENPHLFYSYIDDLRMQCEEGASGRFVLSRGDKVLSLDKNAFMILNLSEIDINNKKILSKLYSCLKEQAYDSELYMDTNKVIAELNLYLEAVIEHTDYAIEYEQDVDITGIFKLAGIRLQNSYDALIEKILDYIEIMYQLLGLQIGIFLNLHSFLTKEELEKLYDMAAYRKIQLILLENHVPPNAVSREKLYIIDDTGCEIY